MFRKFVVALWLLALPATALADTRVDLDRHKDFSRYKTFTVEIGPLVRADGVVDEQNTLAENRLRQAITRGFQARGLETTDVGPDLTIRVSSRDTERTAILSSGWHSYPWSLRRRWGYWRGWGYWGGPGYWGPYAGDVVTRRYLERSLVVDVIERATHELVYRAEVTDEVGKNLDKQVLKTVDKALKKFPIREVVSN